MRRAARWWVTAISLCACRDERPAPATPVKAEAPAKARDEVEAAPARKVEAPTDLVDASMVALADDGLLLWTPRWARLRAPEGTWYALDLPPRTHLVESGSTGVLAAASDQADDGTVLTLATLFDARGRERGRWRVAAQTLNLAFHGAEPVLLTSRGMVALGPGGKANEPVPYGPHTPLPIGGAGKPYWFERNGEVTTCLGNLPTERYPIAAQCERTGEHGYHVAVPFLDARQCGASLVVLTGEQANEVAVYDLASGRSAGRRLFTKRPVLSCVDDELVVGTAHAIERLRLPALDLVAQITLPAGQALRDLAVSRGRIAYRRVSAPNDLVFVAR